MNVLIAIAIIIVSLALIGIVLIQNAKGGGLASNMGVNTQMFGGVKKQPELIEKVTWGLVIALFVLCLASGVKMGSGGEERVAPRVDGVATQPMQPGTPATQPQNQPLFPAE